MGIFKYKDAAFYKRCFEIKAIFKLQNIAELNTL